jgi:aminopeptidase-like protein
MSKSSGSMLLSEESAPIDLYELVRTLFPIPRSITGAGVRKTLDILGQYISLSTEEVASGTPVLDWEVPLEWSIRSATLRTLDGRCLVDFETNNLHIVGYSRPVHEVVSYLTARDISPAIGASVCRTIFG